MNESGKRDGDEDGGSCDPMVVKRGCLDADEPANFPAHGPVEVPTNEPVKIGADSTDPPNPMATTFSPCDQSNLSVPCATIATGTGTRTEPVVNDSKTEPVVNDSKTGIEIGQLSDDIVEPVETIEVEPTKDCPDEFEIENFP